MAMYNMGFHDAKLAWGNWDYVDLSHFSNVPHGDAIKTSALMLVNQCRDKAPPPGIMASFASFTAGLALHRMFHQKKTTERVRIPTIAEVPPPKACEPQPRAWLLPMVVKCVIAASLVMAASRKVRKRIWKGARLWEGKDGQVSMVPTQSPTETEENLELGAPHGANDSKGVFPLMEETPDVGPHTAQSALVRGPLVFEENRGMEAHENKGPEAAQGSPEVGEGFGALPAADTDAPDVQSHTMCASAGGVYVLDEPGNMHRSLDSELFEVPDDSPTAQAMAQSKMELDAPVPAPSGDESLADVPPQTSVSVTDSSDLQCSSSAGTLATNDSFAISVNAISPVPNQTGQAVRSDPSVGSWNLWKPTFGRQTSATAPVPACAEAKGKLAQAVAKAKEPGAARKVVPASSAPPPRNPSPSRKVMQPRTLSPPATMKNAYSRQVSGGSSDSRAFSDVSSVSAAAEPTGKLQLPVMQFVSIRYQANHSPWSSCVPTRSPSPSRQNRCGIASAYNVRPAGPPPKSRSPSPPRKKLPEVPEVRVVPAPVTIPTERSGRTPGAAKRGGPRPSSQSTAPPRSKSPSRSPPRGMAAHTPTWGRGCSSGSAEQDVLSQLSLSLSEQSGTSRSLSPAPRTRSVSPAPNASKRVRSPDDGEKSSFSDSSASRSESSSPVHKQLSTSSRDTLTASHGGHFGSEFLPDISRDIRPAESEEASSGVRGPRADDLCEFHVLHDEAGQASGQSGFEQVLRRLGVRRAPEQTLERQPAAH